MKSLLIATSVLAIAAVWSGAAGASSSIKDSIPPADLAAYCAAAGVGTETIATFTLSDGTVLTGSVHCEAEDLAGSTDGGDSSDILDTSDDDSALTGDDDGEDDSATSSDDGEDDDHSSSGSGDHEDEHSGSGGSGHDDDEGDD